MSEKDVKIKCEDVLKHFNISRKYRSQFVTRLQLLLEIESFKEKDGAYIKRIDESFNSYFKGTQYDGIYIKEKDSEILRKFISNMRLPFKITYEEGIGSVINKRFIKNMIVLIYSKYIVLKKEFEDAESLVSEVSLYLNRLGFLNISNKDILFEVRWYFDGEKGLYYTRELFMQYKEEIINALNIILDEVSSRFNIKTQKIKENILCGTKKINNETDLYHVNDLKKEIERLRDDLEFIEYKNKRTEDEMREEICELRKNNLQSLDYATNQYKMAMIDLIKELNDVSNGNILDRIYCYVKGYEEETDFKALLLNLLAVFERKGILGREILKIGDEVELSEYAFNKYRLSNDITLIKSKRGVVQFPAWFYKNEEILKEYVKIKEE